MKELFKRVKKFYKRRKQEKNPVILKGNNWLEKQNAPIALLFGFNSWKREIIFRYLDDYRVAHVFGAASWRRIQHEFIDKYADNEKIVFVRWGNKKLPFWALVWAKFHKETIEIISIEDGFLRSIGQGLLHTKPASLCIDNRGIYFNAKKESALEKILNTYDFKADTVLMNRAKASVSLIKAANITKYYAIVSKDNVFKRNKNYSILVVGQVEDDASIIYGKSKIKLNTKLVMQARKEHPTADIYFRPHPDYIAENRKSISNINEIKSICAILDNDISLESILQSIDHVYTITSLVGFEALIKGVKVTTFGAPFYSNWGLTDDRVKIFRRGRTLTLEELVAGAYLLYPKYLHLDSDEFITFEETASYFIFELIKNDNIFNLHTNNKLYKKCMPLIDSLSTPLKVMKYLNETQTFCEADTEKVMKFVTKEYKVSDYPQISYLLIKTSNYDALIRYSNYSIDYLKNNIDTIYKNTTMLENFFYALSLSLKNTNGRIITQIPDLSSYIIRDNNSDKNQFMVAKNYILCCSLNLQYDEIESFLALAKNTKYFNDIHQKYWSLDDLVNSTMSFRTSLDFYETMANILNSKSSRSERNINKRHQLMQESSVEYLSLLNERYNNTVDPFLNAAMYYILHDNIEDVEKNLKFFIKKLNIKNIFQYLEKNNRINQFMAMCNWLIKKKRFEIVDNFLEAYPHLIKDEKYAFFILNLYKMKNNRIKYYAYIDKLPIALKKSDKISTAYARTLREDGFFSASLSLYTSLSLSASTLARKINLETEISKVKFCMESSQILNSIPQPKLPKGVVFISSQTCFNTLAMIIPSLVELKKKGYAVINLTQGMTEKAPTGFEYIDKFEGIIPLNLTYSSTLKDLRNSWEIDWENKKIISNGINFYQGFYERISTTVRRYHVDINDKHCYNELVANLLRADACLYVCNKIYSEIINKTVTPVTFMSGNSHVTPYSVFRDFTMYKNHERMGFMNCNVAYESYFSNVGSKFANTMAVTDMTLYPTLRAPFMARKDQFDKWYIKNKENEKYIEIANTQIKVNRVGNTSNSKELEIIKFLEKEKAKGKKILCAFGKVTVDLNVPFDRGPAHGDMVDWIIHTVQVCNERDDIILLVKPHPHELKPEIALDLVQSFHDLIDCEVKKNVLLLGHKDINGHALAPYLDLAILYNGSTAIELTAQGVPVILTSYFGKHDYPIDLIYPSDRKQYKDFLLSLYYPIPDDETRKKSAFLISYLGTDEISTINQYSLRQLTNDRVGIPTWNYTLINKFLKDGDSNMEYIATKVVEKFQ